MPFRGLPIESLDDRFVNIAGDLMTGSLMIRANLTVDSSWGEGTFLVTDSGPIGKDWFRAISSLAFTPSIMARGLSPFEDNAHDLGALDFSCVDYRWRDLFLAGSLNDGAVSLTIANAKTAYDHSILVSGNPHVVTLDQAYNAGKTIEIDNGDLIINLIGDEVNPPYFRIQRSGVDFFYIYNNPIMNVPQIASRSWVPIGDDSEDLGYSGMLGDIRWRDLFLSRNISDGINSIIVANIPDKSVQENIQPGWQFGALYVGIGLWSPVAGTIWAEDYIGASGATGLWIDNDADIGGNLNIGGGLTVPILIATFRIISSEWRYAVSTGIKTSMSTAIGRDTFKIEATSGTDTDLHIKFYAKGTGVVSLLPFVNLADNIGALDLYWGNIYSQRLLLNATAILNGATAGHLLFTGDLVPATDDLEWIGQLESPFKAIKGLIIKDTTDGKHYKVEVISGVVTATALD